MEYVVRSYKYTRAEHTPTHMSARANTQRNPPNFAILSSLVSNNNHLQFAGKCTTIYHLTYGRKYSPFVCASHTSSWFFSNNLAGFQLSKCNGIQGDHYVNMFSVIRLYDICLCREYITQSFYSNAIFIFLLCT